MFLMIHYALIETRVKTKKMMEAPNGLIEDVKANTIIKIDLKKSKSCNLINLIKALDELN